MSISVTQVSKLVNSLKDKGYINIEMVYKENSKEVDIRKLIPIEEKFKDNKYNINKYKNTNNKRLCNFEQRDYEKEGSDWNSLCFWYSVYRKRTQIKIFKKIFYF